MADHPKNSDLVNQNGFSSCNNPSSASTMSVSSMGFKWVDILEKDFDKSFVTLEEVFRGFSEEYEVYELYELNRKLLSNMGSCFVQTVHKAQSVFQAQAKAEAELIHLREELAETKANFVKLDSEKRYLVCQLQTALLDNHKLRNELSPITGSNDPDEKKEEQLVDQIQLKLAKEMAVIRRVDLDARKTEVKMSSLERENCQLRKELVELESELVGARLDARYLDKELAGRIQQIQILLAAGTSQDHKQRVWNQIEAEMHLQRSKTISNMCFAKQKLKEDQSERDSTLPASRKISTNSAGDRETKGRFATHKEVQIHKNDSEELGMAILGGREHGLPVMISEVFPETAVSRSKGINAGDIIRAVNGEAFADIGHEEAVKYLSSLRGTIVFELECRIDDEVEEICDMETKFYGAFDESVLMRKSQDDESGSPRFKKHPGRASKISPLNDNGNQEIQRHRVVTSLSDAKDEFKEDQIANNNAPQLPKVHSSPVKNSKVVEERPS